MFHIKRIKSSGLTVLFLITSFFRLAAQDSTVSLLNTIDSKKGLQENSTYTLNLKKLIIPAAFIGYGIASLHIKDLKQLNYSTKNEINEHKPDPVKLDNYTQYAPALIVYGLNALGIKGKHNFTDRTIIYASSQLLAAGFVVPLKRIVKEERPDGSNNESFPSGHTATAFSTAHFMFKEYKG